MVVKPRGIRTAPKREFELKEWAKAETAYWMYQFGIRQYCWQCDVNCFGFLRWSRHRYHGCLNFRTGRRRK